MNIVIGSGKNRQTFALPTGVAAREMEKKQPIEYVKIKGNLMSLIRKRQGDKA